MNKEEAFKIGLNKWVQLVVNGKSITEEQALEIIRRTDSAFYGGEMYGNNHSFIEKADKILKRPKCNLDNFNEYIKQIEEWQNKWNLVKNLEYLKNNWVSCSWIGGCYGWCHPDGTIGFCNNIGKYPKVENIYNELCILGKEFPFLELECTITDREESEEGIQSLVTLILKDGQVNIVDPIPYEKLKLNGISFNDAVFSFLNGRSENYFSLDQIQKWANENL